MGLWEEESRASAGERPEDTHRRSHTGAQSSDWEQNVRSRMQKPDPVPAASWGQEIHPGGSRSRLRTGCLGLFHIWGGAGTAGGGQALGWEECRAQRQGKVSLRFSVLHSFMCVPQIYQHSGFKTEESSPFISDNHITASVTSLSLR